MTTFQMIISIIGVVVSVLTLFGLGVVMKHFWDDKHEKVKASRSEAKERAKRERQEEIREVIKEQMELLKKELQKEIDSLKEEIGNLKEGVDDVKAKVERLQHSMVTVDRIIMKLTLDQYREQGYASSSDRAAWSELYKDYKDLGGNHFKEYVNEWKRSLDTLPDRDDIVNVERHDNTIH